jgi:hypothetical protein
VKKPHNLQAAEAKRAEKSLIFKGAGRSIADPEYGASAQKSSLFTPAILAKQVRYFALTVAPS